nr:hypothetical protein [Tanacetum cinerariifolium]
MANTVNEEGQLEALVDGKKIIIIKSTIRRDFQLEDAEVNLIVYTSCIEKFWATIMAKTVNGERQLEALVDGKKIIIIESTIRRAFQLEDAEGVDCLPNVVIFEQLTLMGLGGGPRCQKAIGDTVAQARFERVSKISNDPLLTRVNTPQSREDNKGLGEEGASKQGTIADIDAIEDIYLVNVHKDEDMFGVNDSDGDEVSVVDEVNVVSTATTTTAIIDDITLAKALMEIKIAKPKTTAASTRPKAKGLVIHEQEQPPTLTVSSQQPS